MGRDGDVVVAVQPKRSEAVVAVGSDVYANGVASIGQPKNVDVDDLLEPLDVEGFRNLDKMHTAPQEVPNDCAVWPSTVNMYEDVLPDPETRVKLAVFENNPATDYINANYVRDRAGNFTWIAAQGPMESTTNAFWRMAWEKKVPVIIMLTRTMEDGVPKCAKYLPGTLAVPEQHGLFEVTLDSFGAFPENQTRQTCYKSYLTIALKKKDGSVEKRQVIHFWLNSWPDHGRPRNAAHMIELAASIRTLRNAAKSKLQRPTLVHCSAGVGRTGSFLAMIDALDAIHAGQKVDILEIIGRLRNDRCRLVNSVLQYEFLWDAAYEYICMGNNVIKHKMKELPRLEHGTNPGFTLSGPNAVHSGNANDELLNAFFIKSVKPGSVAEKSGFEAGDRIYEITHAGIPTGKDQKPLVFRLKGKTLDVVMAELKRGIATGKPVQMKVAKQKIAMGAQLHFRDEEAREQQDGGSTRYEEDDEDSAPKMQRRIEHMKSLYRRQKESAADDAEEDAIVQAAEEYEDQQDREYEERVLLEMEELASEQVEEFLALDASAARLNSTELKNEVISKFVGQALGVSDSYDPDCGMTNVCVDIPDEEHPAQAVTKEVSFSAVDQQHWNDDEFMDHMFGHVRTQSYTQANGGQNSMRTTGQLTPKILDNAPECELRPDEAEAAGVSRQIFRQLDTDHDGKITIKQLRKASLAGLLGPLAQPETASAVTVNPTGWSTTNNIAAEASMASRRSSLAYKTAEFSEPNENDFELNSPPPPMDTMINMSTGCTGVVQEGDTYIPVVDV
eukprot:m.17438 g.17438  ORF g.17438 m.17438 type:complete len:786 (+) comp9325_c0_seq1:2-2359(+)